MMLSIIGHHSCGIASSTWLSPMALRARVRSLAKLPIQAAMMSVPVKVGLLGLLGSGRCPRIGVSFEGFGGDSDLIACSIDCSVKSDLQVGFAATSPARRIYRSAWRS